jgi:hypothetical protein
VPLIRDGYFGENFEGSLEFSMRNGDAVVEFTVGPSVLDAIDGVYETLWDQRDEQFLRLRNRIETVAMRRFGDNPSSDQMAIALSAADFQRWDGQSKQA